MQIKRTVFILIGVATLLLIPFVAMQFTEEVNWTSSDFVTMGLMLTTTGLLGDWVLRKVKRPGRRFILIGVILFIFFLIWGELAVGLFGTPFAGS